MTRKSYINIDSTTCVAFVVCSPYTQQTQSICITFVQRRPNVFDVGPTLYKCHTNVLFLLGTYIDKQGGGPRVVVSTAAFHARARGSVPGLGGLKETKCFFPIHV